MWVQLKTDRVCSLGGLQKRGETVQVETDEGQALIKSAQAVPASEPKRSAVAPLADAEKRTKNTTKRKPKRAK